MRIVHKWIENGLLNPPDEVDWIQIQVDPHSMRIQCGRL